MAFVIFTLRGALNEAENTGEMKNEGVEKVHKEVTWADNESLSRSTRVQRRRYDRYLGKWFHSFGLDGGFQEFSITHEPAYKQNIEMMRLQLTSDYDIVLGLKTMPPWWSLLCPTVNESKGEADPLQNGKKFSDCELIC